MLRLCRLCQTAAVSSTSPSSPDPSGPRPPPRATSRLPPSSWTAGPTCKGSPGRHRAMPPPIDCYSTAPSRPSCACGRSLFLSRVGVAVRSACPRSTVQSPDSDVSPDPRASSALEQEVVRHGGAQGRHRWRRRPPLNAPSLASGAEMFRLSKQKCLPGVHVRMDNIQVRRAARE